MWDRQVYYSAQILAPNLERRAEASEHSEPTAPKTRPQGSGPWIGPLALFAGCIATPVLALLALI